MASPYVQQQPMATQGMVAGGGNKNAKNLPVDATGRDWSNGIFDCFNDAGTCLLSCFVPCIVYGQNKQRLEHLQQNGTVDPEHGGLINNDCLVHGAITACCGCGWVLQVGNRSNTRSRYNVRGDTMTDCCLTFWCNPCALTQEAQEIQLEEQSMEVYQKA